MQLILSIFPGIDLLGRAFEEAGFCIVRGPDCLWGGDIRSFNPPPGVFWGICGGPPCQAFSSLAHMVRHNGYEPKFGNLIPEFERCVAEAQPQWFLMEEVPQAPVPIVEGYGVHDFILNNRQLGEAQNRKRRISFGWRGERRVLMIEVVALESQEFEYAACGGSQSSGLSSELSADTEAGARARARKRGREEVAIATHQKRSRRNKTLYEASGGNVKSSSSFKRLCELQGLPTDFLKDSPLTVSGKCKAVGNSVPMAMSRALAKAVKEATTE